MLQIAEGLSLRGFNVDLVLIEAEGELISQVSSNVRVINLSSRKARYSIWKLVLYLNRERPTGLISAHDSANVIAIVAKFLSCSNPRLIITINSHLSHAYNPLNDKNLARFNVQVLFKIIKFTYQFADETVAISSGAADEASELTKIPKDHIRIFFLPVITDRFNQLKKQSVENPFLFSKKIPNILAVGRLTPAKDFVTLIKAFAIVIKNIPARLVILGEGESRSQLEDLVFELGLKDKVLLPGYVDNCYPYMVSCDLFVVSSAWEGLSMVLIEALACGAPVVSTDCKSGPREILQDGKWGRLVPVGEKDILAKAIKKSLIKDQKKIKVPDHVLDPFRQDVVAKKYQKLIFDNENLK